MENQRLVRNVHGARRLALFTLAGFALMACQARGRPERGRATAPAMAAANVAPAEAPLVAAQRLALQRTDGDAALDRKIAQLSAAAKAAPRRLATLVELARAWVQKARQASDPGYYVNANAAVDLALDIAPGDPSALDVRMLVLLNDHRFAEAEALAREALRRAPDSAMAWGSLSDALLELGDLEGAEQASQTMLDLKPNLPSYSRASYLRWLRGDVAGARELARLALDAASDRRDPEPRAWMLVQAALLFWHEGDLSGADAGFEKALQGFPEYPPALVGRARVALARGEPGRATALLERAYAKSPLAETAWLLSDARLLAGDATGAARACSDAERAGRRGDARTLSLLLASRGKDLERALRLAQNERAQRGDIYSDDALAWALYKNGRFAEAKAAIERARRWETRDARLIFHEAAIRIALGDAVAGRRLLRAVEALNPHFEPLAQRELRALLQSAARQRSSASDSEVSG